MNIIFVCLFRQSAHIAHIVWFVYSCRHWGTVKNLLQNQELLIMKSVAQRKQFSSIPKTVIQRISPELVIRWATASMCIVQCSGSLVYYNFLLVYRNLMTELRCSCENSDIICRIKNDEIKMFIVIIFFQGMLQMKQKPLILSIACALSQLIAVFLILFSISPTFLVFICQVMSRIAWKTFCVFLTQCLHEHCLKLRVENYRQL
jgi:hypothetical protein